MQRLPLFFFLAGAFGLLEIYLVLGTFEDNSVLLRFGVHEVSRLQSIISWFLALLPVLILPLEFSRPSAMAAWVVLLFVHIPIHVFGPHVLYAADGGYTAFQFAQTAAFLILCLVSRMPLPPKLMKPANLTRNNAALAVAAMGAVVIVLWAATAYGFRFLNPLSEDLYFRREDVGASQVLGGVALSYLFSWAAGVFSILIVSFGLIRRSPSLIAFGILICVIQYGINPHKTLFLVWLLPAWIYFAKVKSNERDSISAVRLVAPVCGVIFASYAIDSAFGDGEDQLITRVLVGRNTLIPGILTALYYDTAQFLGFNQYADSIIGKIFRIGADSNFDAGPAQTIGWFFGNTGEHANANYVADAYINLGMPGVFIYCGLIVSLFFYIVDWLARGRPVQVTCSVFAVQALAISNTGFHTTFLNTGMAAAVAMTWFMSSEAAVENSSSVSQDSISSNQALEIP